MLKRITTKNFRKHADRTFEFGPGLQVVRGANEDGKTTLLEAIAYVNFGAKACRDPLAEVVTWGQPANSLSVEEVLMLEGTEYVVTRSPRGAEVNYDGGRVVGQAEVTAFMERLLGANSNSAGRLMIASQGQIRGALEEGPTATMKLIEQLADFAVIDNVIELLQAAYVTGPTAAAELRVVEAEAALKAAEAGAVMPDLQDNAAQLAMLSADISRWNQEINTELKPAHDAAQTLLKNAGVADLARKSLLNQIAGTTGNMAKRQAQRREAVLGTEQAPTPTAIAAARAALAAATDEEAQEEIYRQCLRLDLKMPYWVGDEESFNAEVKSATRLVALEIERVAGLEKDFSKSAADIRVLEAKLVTGTACGFCGKDVRGIPEIAAKNKVIEDAIHAERDEWRVLEAALSGAKESLESARETVRELTAVEIAAQPARAFRARYGEHPGLMVSDATFPPSFDWTGRIPGGTNALADARAALTLLERAESAAIHAQARVTALDEQIANDVAAIAEFKKQVVALAVADQLPQLQSDFHLANDAYNAAAGKVAEATYTKNQVEAAGREALATYEMAKRGVATAQAAVDKAREALIDLTFNNALLKRIKAARPVIADKLWSIVLTAVSTYFSAMRGTKSVIVRSGNEFLVDGKKVGGGSLSGSALDILGLAIRLALSRTFLPNAPFLILDEPSAAMDEERTAMMMGFLVAAGFPQTLLVTHEEMSETVADNLITI